MRELPLHLRHPIKSLSDETRHGTKKWSNKSECSGDTEPINTPAGGRLPLRGRWTGRSPGRMRGPCVLSRAASSGNTSRAMTLQPSPGGRWPRRAGRGAVPGPPRHRPTPVRASPCHPLPGEGFPPHPSRLRRAALSVGEGNLPAGDGSVPYPNSSSRVPNRYPSCSQWVSSSPKISALVWEVEWSRITAPGWVLGRSFWKACSFVGCWSFFQST